MQMPAQVHHHHEVIHSSPPREVIYHEPVRVSHHQQHQPIQHSTVTRMSHSHAQPTTVIRGESRVVTESQPTRIVRQAKQTRVSHSTHGHQVMSSQLQGSTVTRDPVVRRYQIDANGNRVEVDGSNVHQSSTVGGYHNSNGYNH